MAIECLILGAGQEVGKSCVVVTVGGKKIMFDCGMHMGRPDDPYPDFSRISPKSDFDSVLSCIVITHFHLDHVGALPFFTEVCGYHGPIYMTYPTKALAPLMLEDYRKVMVERRGENQQFTYEHIVNCMKKAITLDVKQTVQVDKDLQIRAYYAGHVLGAAMIYAKVGENSLVYTGDYNMTPDRHLGAAHIDKLQLDLLITESTYATTIRDSKYTREREFLKVVHECIKRGGKVLIPTFAMGRAQELCLLLEDYWERMNLSVPIYFSAVLPFDRSMIDAPGPCVLFATPGMLTGGFSVEVFKHWAPSEGNLVTLPGFCLAGTLGHKLMSGKATKVDLNEGNQIDVRCQIHQLSFSPHTDAKGIMDLVRFLSPKNVVLVHGEKPNMEKLKYKIQSELEIQCYVPANNENVIIQTSQTVKIDASRAFLRHSFAHHSNGTSVTKIMAESSCEDMELVCSPVCRDEKTTEGILIMDKTKRARLVLEDELLQILNKEKHELKFCYCCPVDLKSLEEGQSTSEFDPKWLSQLRPKLETALGGQIIQEGPGYLSFGSLQVRFCGNEDCPFRKKEEVNSFKTQSVFFCCSWSLADEHMARRILKSLRNLT